jgi:hypothetical protein
MKFYNEYYRLNRYLNPDPYKPNDYEEKILDFLLYIEKYVNLATVQMQRLSEDEEEMIVAQETPSHQSIDRRLPFIKFWGDIHFLFN